MPRGTYVTPGRYPATCCKVTLQEPKTREFQNKSITSRTAITAYDVEVGESIVRINTFADVTAKGEEAFAYEAPRRIGKRVIVIVEDSGKADYPSRISGFEPLFSEPAKPRQEQSAADRAAAKLEADRARVMVLAKSKNYSDDALGRWLWQLTGTTRDYRELTLEQAAAAATRLESVPAKAQRAAAASGGAR